MSTCTITRYTIRVQYERDEEIIGLARKLLWEIKLFVTTMLKYDQTEKNTSDLLSYPEDTREDWP